MLSVVASTLYLCIYLFFGLSLSRWVLPRRDVQTHAVFSCGFGLATLIGVPALVSLALGFRLSAALVAGALVLVAGVLLWQKGDKISLSFQPSFWWCVLPLCALSFWLLHTHTLYLKDGAYWCGQSTYGDLPMHLSYIKSIAEQGHFPPRFPMLAGQDLYGYPFLCESVSSVFLLFGASLKFASLLPQFVAFFSVLGGGWLLGRELLDSSKKASLAYWLFFMGSGFGFAYFLGGSKENFTRIFTAFYETPTNYVQENIRWVNPVVDMLIPQRATLFGWALLFPCLVLVAHLFQHPASRLWVGLFVLAGCLPLVQTHSALALFLICLVVFVAVLIRHKISWQICKPWILFGAATGVVWLWLMGTQIFPQTASGHGFLRFHFNWANESDSYLWFYIKNIGLVYLLLIPAFLWASKTLRWFYGGGLAILALSEFVVFQPNNYDNNKLLFIWHLLSCILVANLLVDWLSMVPKPSVRYTLAALLITAGTLGSVLTMGRELVSGYQHFNQDAIAVAEYAEEHTHPDDRFLTGLQVINPVLSLAGRPVLCTSGAWLYFHGMDYSQQEQAVKQLYETPSLELMHQWEVKYVVISSWERADYQVDQTWFDTNATLLFEQGEYQLYQIPN